MQLRVDLRFVLIRHQSGLLQHHLHLGSVLTFHKTFVAWMVWIVPGKLIIYFDAFFSGAWTTNVQQISCRYAKRHDPLAVRELSDPLMEFYHQLSCFIHACVFIELLVVCMKYSEFICQVDDVVAIQDRPGLAAIENSPRMMNGVLLTDEQPANILRGVVSGGLQGPRHILCVLITMTNTVGDCIYDFHNSRIVDKLTVVGIEHLVRGVQWPQDGGSVDNSQDVPSSPNNLTTALSGLQRSLCVYHGSDIGLNLNSVSAGSITANTFSTAVLVFVVLGIIFGSSYIVVLIENMVITGRSRGAAVLASPGVE